MIEDKNDYTYKEILGELIKVEELKESKSDNENMDKHGGDPHHPNHPRNRSNKQTSEEDVGESSPKDKERPGGDPHHPNHPRNR